MKLNETPSGERITIGFFGMRNAGKSSLVNALTDQSVSVVSDTPGTTTDPVKKAMELLPLGAVVIVDTPGFDDVGDLGELRVKTTRRTLAYTDIAVVVIDAQKGMSMLDISLISELEKRNIPYVKAYNKSDASTVVYDDGIAVSARDKKGIEELKAAICGVYRSSTENKRIVTDILCDDPTVLLVMPIDEAAPKGRIILPQQQTIRDILDAHGACICCQPEQLSKMLECMESPPDIVITDSQVFGKVASIVPDDIPLTSFSILFARYKGELQTLVDGAMKIHSLNDGDTVLISEGCTHRRSCKDIGSVKIPNMMRSFTKKELNFVFSRGGEFPDDLSGISLVVHCGGCMLNQKEMHYRMATAEQNGVPMVNYGVAIAEMNGILRRSLKVFSDIKVDKF
ncbi:MAG: [Clostridia bacterium]|nr:[FeFe] hydrogenase H-cluster maturation GTPase HydF [Clostridia bacterium]